jgi:hypothetical protein
MSVERLRGLIKEIENSLKESIEKKNFEPIVEEAADMVKLRTRLGYGVERPGAGRQRLKPLKDSYKKQRANKVRFWTDPQGRVRSREIENGGGRHPELSSETTPSKSNLTFTGQMIDSVEGRATGNGKGVISVTGTRNDGMRNSEVAQYVTDAGRPFISLSNIEIKRIVDMLRRSILDRVRRKL